MLVMITETVTQGLRGELSRWLIEISPGIFVGSVSALVRDQLWELASIKIKQGGVTQIYNAKNEQGFTVRQEGITTRKLVDFDGLLLVKMLKS